MNDPIFPIWNFFICNCCNTAENPGHPEESGSLGKVARPKRSEKRIPKVQRKILNFFELYRIVERDAKLQQAQFRKRVQMTASRHVETRYARPMNSAPIKLARKKTTADSFSKSSQNPTRRFFASFSRTDRTCGMSRADFAVKLILA